MSLVFQDPPVSEGPASRLGGVRERSPLRKEIDDMLSELSQHPQRWARLFDFSDKEEAEKRATQVRTAAGKGWNVATRRLDDGVTWSVFARMRSAQEQAEADAKRAEAKARKAAEARPPDEGLPQAGTFQ